MKAIEINFDGLVGPSHNYAGLSPGNLASQAHRDRTSNPKAAALQGLAKMKFLHDLGVPQGVLPPAIRPHRELVRRLGFDSIQAMTPQWRAAVFSASSMWAANAATVSPAADTADGRLHLTPANLVTQLHRSIEPPTTTAVLRQVFPNAVIHDPLPATDALADEGAANHMRLWSSPHQPGTNVFVYGRSMADRPALKFPARQTREVAEAVARLHGLSNPVFLQQSPAAIDAGAFHNDVVAVAHQDVLLAHAGAFVDPGPLSSSAEFRVFLADEFSLDDAVSTYIFNSQIVTLADGALTLIAPSNSRGHLGVDAYLRRVIDAGAIDAVHYVDVRQSMNNGGGPACLRLRVTVDPADVHPGVMLTPSLHQRLVDCVNSRYRDVVTPATLLDPTWPIELFDTTQEIHSILGLAMPPSAE